VLQPPIESAISSTAPQSSIARNLTAENVAEVVTATVLAVLRRLAE
jgi:hypothetical protein